MLHDSRAHPGSLAVSVAVSVRMHVTFFRGPPAHLCTTISVFMAMVSSAANVAKVAKDALVMHQTAASVDATLRLLASSRS